MNLLLNIAIIFSLKKQITVFSVSILVCKKNNKLHWSIIDLFRVREITLHTG